MAELRLEQGHKVVHDVSQLQADFWPEEETIEEFEQYFAEERADYLYNPKDFEAVKRL